ncbi:MAG: DUF3343 domain-containing protein [Ruminococcus sp.]|nr:DUF3343 domain-containing protein [Ruminococcus sp.]
MAQCIAEMPSYTYAMKAEKLLKSRNIPCRVIRSEKTDSNECGYSLEITGSCKSAAVILKNYSIPYTGIS